MVVASRPMGRNSTRGEITESGPEFAPERRAPIAALQTKQNGTPDETPPIHRFPTLKPLFRIDGVACGAAKV